VPILTFGLFFIGLTMIVKGGDWFLDSIIWIAEKTGISYGIIGATVVSMATTLPELFVSSVASNEGFTDMAVGNALGSYICNIAFIIGICAIIKPIKVRDDYFGVKGALMFGHLSIFYFFASDGIIGYWEGKILIGLIVLFFIVNLFEYSKEIEETKKIKTKPRNNKEVLLNGSKFAIGSTFIIIGAHILVSTGVDIANIFRIPKQVVSLTLLAIGTSLPELVTALAATVKDKQNISLGNILGANILNMTAVMGISTMVSDSGLIISSQTLRLDVPIATIVALIFILSGILFKKIGRITGLILLFIYGIYMQILF